MYFALSITRVNIAACYVAQVFYVIYISGIALFTFISSGYQLNVLLNLPLDKTTKRYKSQETVQYWIEDVHRNTDNRSNISLFF